MKHRLGVNRLVFREHLRERICLYVQLQKKTKKRVGNSTGNMYSYAVFQLLSTDER